MRTRDLQTSARLGGLALMALLGLGCATSNNGNGDGGLGGDPPQVTLGVPDNNAVGTVLRLNLSISGCDQVQTVGLYDHDQFMRTVTYTGPSTEIDLQPNQIPYNRQMAANLSLTAKAVCKDGRNNVSPPQAVHFLPVAQVISSPTGGQVVPDTFYADGSGVGTTFVGCSQANGGQRFLIKVGIDGSVQATQTSLPFACSQTSVYTDRNSSSGLRWMWEYDQGVLAYDSNLQVTSWITSQVEALGVGPDGDAIVFVNTTTPIIQRLPTHSGGPTTPASPVWSVSRQGAILGNPVVNSDGSLYLAYICQPGTNTAIICVDRLNYANGQIAGSYSVRRINYGFGNAPALPPTAFSADGSIIYLTNQIADGQSQVIACSTSANDCNGAGALKWTSPILAGNIEAIVPYAAGSRLAVVTAQHTWFLRTDANLPGQTIGGTIAGTGSVDPSGALVANELQPGLGRDIYLLNGPASGGLPLEVVALDNAEQGEVFRYGLLGGSLTAAVADDGQVWLRIGSNLVKPLPLSEYRLVH